MPQTDSERNSAVQSGETLHLFGGGRRRRQFVSDENDLIGSLPTRYESFADSVLPLNRSPSSSILDISEVLRDTMLDLFYAVQHRIITMFNVLKFLVLAVPVAFLIGIVCHCFHFCLQQITDVRQQIVPWMVYLMCVGGILVGLIYHVWGGNVEKGNNLVIDQIHANSPVVPIRMGLLIGICALISHFFGASVGREGIMVQVAASITSLYVTVLRYMRVNVSDASYKMLLIASVSAAFGTAFNLPLTGVLFGMEVLFISHIDYEACIPCLISTATAMWSSNFIQQYVPTDRTTYNTPSITGGTFTHIDILILAQVTGASLIFGVVAAIFAALTHKLRHIFTYICNRHTTIRPVLGGIIIAALFAACGALSLTPESYVGLGETSYKPGVVSIQSSFSAAGAEPYSWILKLIFTSVSIGSGFKGGEVTPLLFIGAALGNFMARYIFFSAHVDLFAAMGFSAVFGAASNTPLTSTILGIEMFGSGTIAIYFAASCFGAYITSGFCGIFYSQLGKSSAKFGGDEIKPTALFNIHENKLILNYRRLW